jgi:hypothetical protein
MNMLTTENKEIIWEIIIESNKDLSEKMKYKLSKFITNRSEYYYNNRFKKTHKELNKMLIDDCMKFIRPQKEKNMNKTLDGIHDRRGSDFENRLKDTQENFTNLMFGNKPKEINFSDDKVHDTIDSNNMDYLMNQTLADRQKELTNITAKYSKDEKKKAIQWIGSNSENSEQNNDIIKLQIKDDVALSNITDIQTKKKKVTFRDDIRGEKNKFDLYNNETFLNEQTNNINKELSDKYGQELLIKMEKILENQEKILEKLGNNTTKLRGPTFAMTKTE